MPENNYRGWTLDELTKLRKSIQSQLSSGRVSEVMAAGVKTAREFSGIENLKQSLKSVEWSLYVLGQTEADAEIKASNLLLYPNPYAEKIMRVETRSSFPSSY